MSKHVAQSLFFQYSFYREPFWYLEALISRQMLGNTFNADLMCDWFYQLCTEILIIFVMIFFVSLIYQNNVNLFSILHLFCTNIVRRVRCYNSRVPYFHAFTLKFNRYDVLRTFVTVSCTRTSVLMVSLHFETVGII